MGASEGGMIIAGTIEVFLNHFVKKMNPFSSVMAPKSYHQVFTNSLFRSLTVFFIFDWHT